VLAASLFVMTPILLGRVAHAALCAHWLIFWSLLIATREARRAYRRWEWAVLGLLAGMIQPYLAAMVAILLAACVLRRSAVAWAARLRALAAAAASMLLGWWASGLFTIAEPGGLSAGGLGLFTANLLAPVTPHGASRFLPELPGRGQEQVLEGFHYYGLGVLLLIAAAVALSWRARRASTAVRPPRLWSSPIVAAFALLTALAVSPRVTFGDRVVVDLLGPWAAPLALFRSSGRFLWPVSYAVLTSAIVAVVRHTPPRAGVGILAAAVAVQAADLSEFYLFRVRVGHSQAFYEWHDPFASPRWRAVTPAFRHLVVWPPPQCGASPIPIENALQFAAARRLTVNTGTLSRGSDIARARYCERVGAEVAAGVLDPDGLYIVSPATAARLREAEANRCGTIDAVTFCTTTAKSAAWHHLTDPA
jgi:hypothetical protein